jgi:hypothetical protein
VQIALADECLRQLAPMPGWVNERQELVDDRLLPLRVSGGLIPSLSRQQYLDFCLPAFVGGVELRDAAMNVFEDPQLIRELAELAGLPGGQASVAHRRRPPFGKTKVMRQDIGLLINAIGKQFLHGLSDDAVERLPLVLYQALVGHFLRERMLEPVFRLRKDANLLDHAKRFQSLERRKEAD